MGDKKAASAWLTYLTKFKINPIPLVLVWKPLQQCFSRDSCNKGNKRHFSWYI